MMKLFDAHLHIIAPGFPLTENQGYLPEPFTVADYEEQAEKLNVKGGAVVSGSFQRFDQTYLIHALEKLGPSFAGVTQLPASVTDEEILQLHAKGVRAVRFNVKRGGSEAIDKLEAFAHRIYELSGWHTELYISSAQLQPIFSVLKDLPQIVIDHLGLEQQGTADLLRLVEHGAKVKATGFSRGNVDVRQMVTDICTIDSEALMFGTDLPSTRAPRPFQVSDIDVVKDVLSERDQNRVFYENGLNFYRINE